MIHDTMAILGISWGHDIGDIDAFALCYEAGSMACSEVPSRPTTQSGESGGRAKSPDAIVGLLLRNLN